MPPKAETKEQREERIKNAEKKVAERSEQHWFDERLQNNTRGSNRSLGTEKYKLSKEIIAEKTADFKARYQDENSDFRKRLAYLQSTMSEEEYRKSPEYRLSQIVDELLENGIREYSDYAAQGEILQTAALEDGRIVSLFTAGQRRKDESTHLKNAIASFKHIEEQINPLVNSEYGKSEAFQEFYADVKNLQEETKRITSGGLVVRPADDDFIFHVKLTEKVDVVDPQTGQKTKKTVLREPILDPVKKPKQEGQKKPEYYPIEYVSFADEPLFSHEPCPEDIQQGALGDCYFIATMSAVAENNPDFIRNCMVDNGDGTVTVRLYDNEANEIYTTVNKTVPMYQRDNGDWVTAYGRGALWVSMLEKAYVQSGVSFDISAEFSRNHTVGRDQDTGKKIDRNSYAEIEGGRTQDASLYILGDYTKQKSITEMTIAFPKKDLLPAGGDYSQAELDFFHRLEKAHNRGDAVTAGINKQENGSNDQTYKSTNGLPSGHAYTIIGTYQDENTGKRFIKVRNPHSRGARAYDTAGNPVYEPYPERPGESMIELRDFEKTFDDCYAATYDNSYFEKKNARLAKDDRLMYGDAVAQACTEIINTDHMLVWTNSKTFTDLKKAAISLKAAFKDQAGHEKMDKELQEFFKAARAYRDDRDTRTIEQQSDSKNARDRSMKRYQLADAVTQFERIYKANQVRGAKLQYVDFASCKESVLDADLEKGYEGASRAKAAAVQGLLKDAAGGPLTSEDAENKINEVEKSGLDKIENGLKNHNSKDLIQGLCEVITARSINSHKAELRPRDIERHLSPESISRVHSQIDQKLKAAIKSIDKDEFLRIMKSPERSKEMAKAVNQHLNENEKIVLAQKENQKEHKTDVNARNNDNGIVLH